MNKARREKIALIIDILEKVQPALEQARDEEQDAFDNLPESIQESERGETMEEYIGYLEDACDSVETALDSLNEII